MKVVVSCLVKTADGKVWKPVHRVESANYWRDLKIKAIRWQLQYGFDLGLYEYYHLTLDYYNDDKLVDTVKLHFGTIK